MSDPAAGEAIVVAGEIRAVDFAGRRVRVRAAAAGGRVLVWCDGETYEFAAASPRSSRRRASSEETGLRAPMPGKILRTFVRRGDEVVRGTTLLILEAMKMEHEIKAPRDGRVAELPFAEGDQVEAGAKLVEFAS
jgi:3-methylcrotonyl-CoA carboxylase alpha subunit